MCGIAGVIAKDELPPQLSSVLHGLAHRGPDGSGELRRGPLWLGHRRLAIIDLSDAALQPMAIDGSGAIIFNGEIYDYIEHRKALEREGTKFNTHSDTEVLLHGLAQYGPEFLNRVHGMYALAWLEPGGDKLWLVRDHAGMKPLYFWRGQNGVAFASEVRALALAVRALGAQPRLSPRALTGFLAWGSVPEPDCILDGAEMAPAGCALGIRVQELSNPTMRLLRPGDYEIQTKGSAEEVVQSIRSSVRRHVVADTPVALFLSGGIDSGVLAAELSKLSGRKPLAISVVLGSRGTLDEPTLIKELVSRLQLPSEMVSVQDWATQLDDALAAYDQPSIDGLNTYLVARVAKRLGFKVALSGVGADEVFGGYRHFHRRVGWLRSLPGLRVASRILEGALIHQTHPKLRRASLLVEGAASGEPAQRSWRRIFSASLIRRLLPGLSISRIEGEPEDPLKLERESYLRDTLLRDTDVMGMAHGVEIRAPYLDPGVLGATSRLGTTAILDPKKPPKWLLRDGWMDELDLRTLNRRKTGFTLNMAQWLRGPAAPLLKEAKAGLASQSCLDQRVLGRVWSAWEPKLESDHPGAWVPLFALVQLNEQFRRWGEVW